jgi:hypothetical protein
MRPEEVFTILCTSPLDRVDVNHDEESVDRPNDLAQSGGMALQQENQAYTGSDHHDEDVGHNQSV